MLISLFGVLIIPNIISDLVSVQVLSVTGDSRPWITLPNVNITGDGRITQQGQNRMAQIGDIIRSRYISNSSLNVSLYSSYDTQWQTFRATPYVDAKDSVNALIYGLFPPGSGPTYNNESIYINQTTIVAVHSSAIDSDTLLWGHTDCPAALYASYKNMISSDWDDILEDYDDVVSDISDATGYSIDSTNDDNSTETAEKTFAMLEAVHELKYMNDSNYALPENVSKLLSRTTDELYRKLFFQRYKKRNQDHCYAAVGFLMYTLMVSNPQDDITAWLNQTDTNYTLYHHYSSDRPTLTLLHDCLGFNWDEDNESIFPEAGAHLIFEIHYDPDNDPNISSPYLKVYYAAAPSLTPDESMYEDITSTHDLNSSTIPLTYMSEKLSDLTSQIESSTDYAFDSGYCNRQEEEDISYSTLYTSIALAAVFGGAALYFFIQSLACLFSKKCSRSRK